MRTDRTQYLAVRLLYYFLKAIASGSVTKDDKSYTLLSAVTSIKSQFMSKGNYTTLTFQCLFCENLFM